MGDDTVRLSTIGQILRRRWRVLLALAVLGALVGAGVSVLFSPGYQTSANVLLQGTRDTSELATEAQVATSSVVLDRSAQALNWGVGADKLRDSVTALTSDGNIVQITATGSTPQRAKQLADQVAKDYVAYSAQLVGSALDATSQIKQEQTDSLRRQVQETSDRITDISRSATGLTVESVEVRTDLEDLRTGLAQAMAKLDELDGTGSQAKVVVMGSAELPSSPAPPTMIDFVGGGAIVFFLVGVLGHLIRARTDRRLRDESQIAAALGAPVLGEVDVPAESVTEDEPEGKARWWATLLRLDRPWNVTEPVPSADEQARDIRYRRVLSRLGDGSGVFKRVIVLAADDDPTARAAVAQLLMAAAGGPTELRVVVTTPERPVVPDDDGASGVLVVMSTGTRTGWDLVGLATACADAHHQVIGSVVAHRARPAAPHDPASAGEQALAGSA
ncbi:MAG TPA: exopolysaccharide biosynthesis protein [Amycolatopsis sp.]|nr:exopolysaccharide biosynthesis protein [Amycolatopsis sp.]